MSWGAVISTGVGVATSALGAGKTSKAADQAAEREQLASDQAIQRSQDAFDQSEQYLAPFAEGERAANSQLMAQLGLTSPGGGGGTNMMGGGRPSSYGQGRQSRQNLDNFDNVLREMMTMAQVRYKRSGYSGSKIHREAAGVVARKLEQMQKAGQLPSDYQMPNTSELTSLAGEIEDSYGGHTKMAKNLYPNIKGGNGDAANAAWQEAWSGAPEALGSRFGVTYAGGDVAPGDVQAGGPGGPMQGEFFEAGTGPQPQTADMIRDRAGLDMLSPELKAQYMDQLGRSAETDEDLAGYLGLTDESRMVGDSYQSNPAYQAARDEGIRTVNQGAAGSGALYSGRRGESLRDVGQQVEQNYYFDAQNRRDDMFRRRSAERGAEVGRLGVEYGADLGRQNAAYNNYMQLLTSASSPTTTTNIENLRQGAATGQNANTIGTARNVGDLKIGAAGAEQAALADIGGGLMEFGSAFIDRDR